MVKLNSRFGWANRLDFINRFNCPRFGCANLFGWAEPEDMRVCVLFYACQIAAGKHSTAAQAAGQLLAATLVPIGDGDTVQVKAPGLRQLIASISIDSANHLIANRAPGTKSRHSNLDPWIRMPDQWLTK